MGSQKHSEEITMLHCKNCGANQHIEENYKSLSCIYCGSPLIIEDAYKEEWILPGAVLPFQIDQKKAFQIFKKWVDGLWFAPNNLKKAAIDPEKTRGLYAPYWTFDAQLYADYTGQRGEYYYVTKTVGSGKNRRTVQERRTRWYPASGSVSGFVDDTLIKASNQKTGVIPQKIARWNLKMLKPFDSGYLSGFVTEKYTIPLLDGHNESNKVAEQIADSWARRDIGGDTQQVSSINMKLSDETFKHILLPVYISTYKFKGKRYNFFVNGQSGIISGQRPYSFWKIFFFVLAIICVIVLIYIFSSK
jgi:DNA-directed RNA polymerase subunit RPC12/RpoP